MDSSWPWVVGQISALICSLIDLVKPSKIKTMNRLLGEIKKINSSILSHQSTIEYLEVLENTNGLDFNELKKFHESKINSFQEILQVKQTQFEKLVKTV